MRLKLHEFDEEEKTLYEMELLADGGVRRIIIVKRTHELYPEQSDKYFEVKWDISMIYPKEMVIEVFTDSDNKDYSRQRSKMKLETEFTEIPWFMEISKVIDVFMKIVAETQNELYVKEIVKRIISDLADLIRREGLSAHEIEH